MSKRISYQAKIVEGDIVPISESGKERITKFLDSKDFRDILTLANQSKPTVHLYGSNPQASNDRLKEISGWEQCEAAILNCLDALKPKNQEPIEEDFNTESDEL